MLQRVLRTGLTLASWTALVAAAALAAPAPSVPARAAGTLTATERVRIADGLHALVARRFAHWEAAPRAAFETRFDTFRRQAETLSDRREFSLLTRALVASLHNGHTTFSDPWMLDVDSLRLPFALVHVEGSWVVSRSSVPGLPVGAVVTQVGEQPVEAHFAGVSRYLCGSNDRARRAQYTSRGFLWPRAFPLTIADHRTVPIQRLPPEPTAPEPPAIEDRWLVRDSIACVTVRSFGDAATEASAIDRICARYTASPVLIVDVRGNGGGSTPRRLAKALLGGRSYAEWRVEPDLVPESFLDRIGAAARRLEPVRTAFTGRLIVLIDGGSASACEDFVMPLAWSHRATLVGDTTCGSTGQPVFADLGAGIRVSVSARRAHFPDGSTFEGVGIAPDVHVPRRREDLVSGRDRVMETALDLARGWLRGRPR